MQNPCSAVIILIDEDTEVPGVTVEVGVWDTSTDRVIQGLCPQPPGHTRRRGLESLSLQLCEGLWEPHRKCLSENMPRWPEPNLCVQMPEMPEHILTCLEHPPTPFPFLSPTNNRSQGSLGNGS